MNPAKQRSEIMPKILYRYMPSLYAKNITPRVVSACRNDNNIFCGLVNIIVSSYL